MPFLHDSFVRITSLLKQKDQKSRFLARQLLFMNSPLSKLVELYLYNNEGQPQLLDKFPMMRAIYDNMPEKLLLKCSRKTLKSTLISNVIALNLIRYNFYRMMYVAPNEQATKRFSHDYLAQRLSSPPLTRIISKIAPNDVYVKGVKDSDSNIILTYASEDATRTRGPATNNNIFDESLSSITLISVYQGDTIISKKLTDIRIGDVIMCSNEYNSTTTDTVTGWKYEGKRHTWKITLESGEQIECTSRTKIFTNLGWLYLTQLLPKSEINRCEKARYFDAAVTAANTTNFRNIIRRWLYEFQCCLSSLPCKPWFKTKRLCSSQSRNTEELPQHSSLSMPKPRIWKRKLRLFYGKYPNIRVYTQNVLSASRGKMEKNCYSKMVGYARLGRNCLLVYGRWCFAKTRSCLGLAYRRIFYGRKFINSSMVTEQGINLQDSRNKWLLLSNPKPGEHLQTNRAYQTLCNSFNVIQNKYKASLLYKLWRRSITRKQKILSKTRLSANQNICQRSVIQGYTQTGSKLHTIENKYNKEAESEKKRNEIEQPSLQRESVDAGTCQICNKESEEEGKKKFIKTTKRSIEPSAIKSIEYAGEQDVYDIETEKYHNFFANGILVHNCQGINLDIVPIINETMAISPIKREIYAGTPLTTDNTINELWKTANQMEWLMRCDCRHWNSLTEDNDPMKMIMKQGLSCSKCGRLLNSAAGQWVDFNPGNHKLQGFHLAQPILPYYNSDAKGWDEIYEKVYGERRYSILQIFNEVFGLPYDVGSKPITEAQLKSLCVLGEMKNVWAARSQYYYYIVMGVDWGVNPLSSRTVCTLAGMRSDGVLEVFNIKIFKNTNYEAQIREIAELAKAYQPILITDCGPDPIRGKMLGNLYDPTKTQLMQYREGLFVQYTDIPREALDWSQTRWCLNRSDVMGFTFDLLNKGRILFPRWEDSSEAMQDILSVFTEVKEVDLKSNIFYRHKNPDDFMHTIVWCASAAHLAAGNSFFEVGGSYHS